MLTIPGRDIFLERTQLNQPRYGALALVLVLVVVCLGGGVFFVIDGRFVGSTLISQALVMWLGLAIVSQLIVRRNEMRRRYGERAFSVAFRWFAIPGLTFVGVGFAHFAWIEGERLVPREVALVPFLYFLATGIVLWVRAILVFGIDNLSMMYVYFPNEGRLVDSNVYAILRHPVYSAAVRVVWALCLWNGSAFALFAALMGPLSMFVWLRLVEERELVERFGESYRAYRMRVPAFFGLNPRAWVGLWRFLLTGK